MATLMAAGNHNFTDAAWSIVDATALLVSSAANTTLTTAYVLSSTFTPGAITIDGIAVWVNTRLGASGTISVALDQATVTVTGTEITIDVADIPAAGNCFVLFKFAAPVLLLAATAYSVKAKTSVATQVNLFRNATAANWSRLLRTTTLAAPGAGDNLYVIGEKTGSGTGNTITVTMDNTATTTWGLVDVSSGGILANGVVAATAYRLKMGGNLSIRSGGEGYIGTSGSRIPSDSTAEWDFANSVNVDFGIDVPGSGRFETWGNHNDVPWALLDGDVSAGATALVTDRVTGWKNGDVIAIAPTTRTATESEAQTLGANAIGTSLPTVTALTNAHAGGGVTNGPEVVAELINLTRNVKLHGTSASLQAYMNFGTLATVQLNDTEVFFMGSGTTNKRGLNLNSTTGSFLADYSSFHTFAVTASTMLAGSGASNIQFTNCVGYFHASQSGTGSPAMSSATGTGNVVSNCVFIRTSSSGTNPGVVVRWNHSISDLRVAGNGGSGLVVSGGAFNGSLTNIVSHSNGGDGGIVLESFTSGSTSTINNLTAWRCSGSGFHGNIAINTSLRGVVVTNLLSFGNSVRNIALNSDPNGLTIVNATVRAGIVLVSPRGLSINTIQITGLIFINSTFGGGGETHSSGDIYIDTAASLVVGCLFDYCSLLSTIEVANQINISPGGMVVSAIRANFLDQTQNHKTWLGNGTWSYDAAFAPAGDTVSLRMTPTSATVKLVSSVFAKSVDSGQTATVSIEVRKSVGGDGAAYNGNQPRLIVRRDYGAGITADTVLDTSTVAGDGAFETLSGTTAAVSNNCALQFYVDCDGTTGWINVGNFTTS
jgi:hypothetical protein